MLKKILKQMLIVQEVYNEQRRKQGLKMLGRGHFKAYRFNPYNPLSYAALVIMLAAGILMFGFVGVWKETNINPFKWD